MARKEREIKLVYGNPFPTKDQCNRMVERAFTCLGYCKVEGEAVGNQKDRSKYHATVNKNIH